MSWTWLQSARMHVARALSACRLVFGCLVFPPHRKTLSQNVLCCYQCVFTLRCLVCLNQTLGCFFLSVRFTDAGVNTVITLVLMKTSTEILWRRSQSCLNKLQSNLFRDVNVSQANFELNTTCTSKSWFRSSVRSHKTLRSMEFVLCEKKPNHGENLHVYKLIDWFGPK